MSFGWRKTLYKGYLIEHLVHGVYAKVIVKNPESGFVLFSKTFNWEWNLADDFALSMGREWVIENRLRHMRVLKREIARIEAEKRVA